VYTASNVIDYVTIATTGNATDFGDLTVSRGDIATASNSTRGIFASGFDASTIQNTIDYITIATTGNATDFGDLSVGRFMSGAAATSLRMIIGGGEAAGGSLSNVIDYLTIATIGNATDFGDLLSANGALAGLSNAHGGL
jgi:hypothetical protein